MTLEELQRESVTEKHLRLLREKCPHEEIYSSTVSSYEGGVWRTVEHKICLDCGKGWHSEDSDMLPIARDLADALGSEVREI